jgi:mycothiol synthase
VTPEQAREVLHVTATAEAIDGAAPLDEATLMTIRLRPDDVRCWTEGGGFALVIDDELHLAVAPDARDAGVGGRLLKQALETVWPRHVEAWSHADHPAARRLAARHGFRVIRELWVMRRSAAAELPAYEPHPDVTIRGYRDSDEAALLALNATSFASHPEQGQMDAANLAERMAESWFDPAGLLVAEDRAGRMLGFHWTKVHDATQGEVYVVAVSPESQGLGLGRLLTLAGLHHLHDRGVREVILYVESDNAPAIRVYRDKLGFTHDVRDTHVMYRR